ncbi:Uncharacterised protein [Candidatus Bilamarchaeum dharawalense]|uniref:Uncharacterized protein n=1 Tax=Candidatus Bilamarchaeum dharawalense TaxID=2885759 RepID=A0A5E4LNX0_9ARCH|nr:Uncharacterised protein [Candidatus Bilamarchaeum dharawalense]
MDFDKIREKYEHVYIQSGRLFAEECKLLEDTISFSFASYENLVKNKLDERSQHLAAFFYRNTIYLSAAYQMVRSGMMDPAGNNMRTIFETIVWQYAYLTDDDVYKNFKEMEDLDSDKLKLIAQKKWSNTSEKKLENLRRKYNFQKMMKSLYSKEVYEKFFFNQYWVLCQKSHSSIFSLNFNTPNLEGTTTMEKRPQEIKDNLTALLYLSTENLLCFLNCFSNYLSQTHIDPVLTFTNQINSKIPPALSLAPDQKELKFTLQFREI